MISDCNGFVFSCKYLSSNDHVRDRYTKRMNVQLTFCPESQGWQNIARPVNIQLAINIFRFGITGTDRK